MHEGNGTSSNLEDLEYNLREHVCMRGCFSSVWGDFAVLGIPEYQLFTFSPCFFFIYYPSTILPAYLGVGRGAVWRY